MSPLRHLAPLGLSFLLASVTHAATVTISPGVTSIQDALASAAPGDSIVLLPGTYSTESSVFVTKPVTILSQAGPGTTIVDLNYNISFGSVFYITADGVVLQGLTIRGGATYALGIGGGVLVDHADATIADNLIIFNDAGNMDGGGGAGGAIYAHDGQLQLRNNTIVGNSCAAGAVFLERCSGSVDHNIFAYNTGAGFPGGYALYCDANFASVTDNVFWANTPEDVHASCGSILGTSGNVVVDPLFCAPNLYGGSWDLGVRADSPVAPGHVYAGRGAPLPMCAATAAARTTWGSVKARYR
jgi:nitrous oxidase accessory protein NosD